MERTREEVKEIHDLFRDFIRGKYKVAAIDQQTFSEFVGIYQAMCWFLNDEGAIFMEEDIAQIRWAIQVSDEIGELMKGYTPPPRPVQGDAHIKPDRVAPIQQEMLNRLWDAMPGEPHGGDVESGND